jgi:hypothetical protein
VRRATRDAGFAVCVNPMGWTAWTGIEDIDILILALDTGEWAMMHNATPVRPIADGRGFASLMHALERLGGTCPAIAPLMAMPVEVG